MSTQQQVDRFNRRHGRSVTLKQPQSDQTDKLGSSTRGTPSTSSANGIPSFTVQDADKTPHGQHPDIIMTIFLEDSETVRDAEDDQPATIIQYNGEDYEVESAVDLSNGWIHARARLQR